MTPSAFQTKKPGKKKWRKSTVTVPLWKLEGLPKKKKKRPSAEDVAQRAFCDQGHSPEECLYEWRIKKVIRALRRAGWIRGTR